LPASGLQRNTPIARLGADTATESREQRFIAPTEHMPEQLVPMIHANRVSAQQPTHPGDQIALRRFELIGMLAS
jgi:hypothetical protein